MGKKKADERAEGWEQKKKNDTKVTQSNNWEARKK